MIISINNREETANALTHGIGLIGAIVVMILLMVYKHTAGRYADTFIYAIYGLSLISCYLSSTIYHLADEKILKQRLKVFDHISIYLLIAGTYTPFCFFVIGGLIGQVILIIIWALALFGSIFKLFYVHRFQRLSTIIYVSMGWMAIFAIKPLIENLDSTGVLLLFGGGLSYTAGVYFYINDQRPYYHAIWHLFVLGGSTFHFLAVWNLLK